jgi:GGDEF domain-containing protein
MSATPRLRRALLGASVATSTVVCLVAVLAGAVAAAALSVAPAIIALVLLAAGQRDDSSTHDALVEKMAEKSETDRKSVIYDRDTGLFTRWYIELRGEEECNRAARYGRPLTLLAVEPTSESEDWLDYRSVALWLRHQLRAVDVAGYLGYARFVVIMPETAVEAAQAAATRLRSEFRQAQTGLSVFRQDGDTFGQLYAVARERLGKEVKRVANKRKARQRRAA